METTENLPGFSYVTDLSHTFIQHVYYYSFQNTSCRTVFSLIQFFIQILSNGFNNNNNNIYNKSIWIPLSRRKEKEKRNKYKEVSIYNIRYTQASILKGLQQDHIHPTIFAPFLPQPTSKKGWGAILSLWSENSPSPLIFFNLQASFLLSYLYLLPSLPTPSKEKMEKV